MYIYNYLHIWRAARNVENAPANNYSVHIGQNCRIVHDLHMNGEAHITPRSVHASPHMSTFAHNAAEDWRNNAAGFRLNNIA